LGKDADAGSLARAKEIRGELLMIFGTKDPHVPEAGREKIDAALRKSGVRYRISLYPAEHAFTRDEGARFDPEATDAAFAEMIGVFRESFQK
jgi:carboxymethylenebutenolidase